MPTSSNSAFNITGSTRSVTMTVLQRLESVATADVPTSSRPACKDITVQIVSQLVSYLVHWAQSTTKDFIKAGHKFHSISELFISQVIIPQVIFFQPIYIPRALNPGTCLRQGDLFYSAGLHKNHVLATANTGNRETFWKKCGWMDWTSRNKQGRNPWQ